ncbi:hypothetical protein MRS44_013461 [Fusarium solani]|uniref:uncharacterized protein n=1 Tax=Fusarium solani TaxID=169388 RepID=UPI0032C3F4E1|nr:hypothetical protein MRS44_013461 [Fusarium solani]
MHALADQLKGEGFWSRIRLDESGRVVAVLFAHPQSLGYLKSYPEVLVLDCTYKTNKYKMPLLDMVGVDACQRSFCIAFAFLSGEEEDDFIWVLQRLRFMYELHGVAIPSVILTDRCLAWHEEWKEFYGFWHEIVASTTEDIYNERLEKFKERYIPDHINEVGYIMETWLDLYKERFVKAWVNQYLHFEQYVTSRCEGIHQLIKSHMKSSQVDLFEAWRIIKLVLSNQLSELEANQARQHISTPLRLSGVLYGNIRGWISHEALQKVEAQRERLLQEHPACTRVFTKTLGLPCAHTLQPLLEQKQPLQLHHFHRHWHLQRSGTPRLIIEPHKQFDRLAASSKLPPTSTQRSYPNLYDNAYNNSYIYSLCNPLIIPVVAIRVLYRIRDYYNNTYNNTYNNSANAAAVPALRADDPRAIFQRYKEAREAWFVTLPRGAYKTNQQYRKAMGLPLRYSKADYDWCLDYKQMGRHCKAGNSIRDWTKEEMMSYLDWDKAENERVEQNVGVEMAEQPFSGRRGMRDIWDAAERDVKLQERWYRDENTLT